MKNVKKQARPNTLPTVFHLEAGGLYKEVSTQKENIYFYPINGVEVSLVQVNIGDVFAKRSINCGTRTRDQARFLNTCE